MFILKRRVLSSECDRMKFYYENSWRIAKKDLNLIYVGFFNGEIPVYKPLRVDEWRPRIFPNKKIPQRPEVQFKFNSMKNLFLCVICIAFVGVVAVSAQE